MCVPLPTGDPDSDQHGLFGRGGGGSIDNPRGDRGDPCRIPSSCVCVCVRETVLRTDTASVLDSV